MLGRLSLTCRAVLTARNSARLFQPRQPALLLTPNVSARFRSSVTDEPEHMVDSQAAVDLRSLKIPFLKDNEKQHIYALYMTDPVKYDVKTIAQTFGMNYERAQAIIYLMHERCEQMRKMGFTVTVENPPPMPDDMYEEYLENTDFLLSTDPLPGPYVKVVIPPLWEALYAFRMKTFRTRGMKMPVFRALFNSSVENPTPETTANMPDDELLKILKTMRDHNRRMGNLRAIEEHYEELLIQLEEDGADIDFAESETITYKQQKFEDQYFPRPMVDEEIESETRFLVNKIEKNTKATINRSVEKFFEEFGDQPAQQAPAEPTSETQSRWKLGFRDIGKEKQLRELQKNSKVELDKNSKMRTVIRTRRGQFRYATPPEEAARSWSHRPTYLSKKFAETFEHLTAKYVTPFINVDGDDHLTAELNKEQMKAKRIAAAKKASEEAK